MPLTTFQTEVAKLLAANRRPESHLAGGAALHFSPNSKRYSNDLDLFHDTIEAVSAAFEADRRILESNGYQLAVALQQPGFVRAVVSKGTEATKVDWAHDSAWRFMPTVVNPVTGYQLHPIDLAVNKTLALAGRDEPRDYVDILYADRNILPLGALCWAAVGKDPGFTPASLLELLKRRGRHRPEDFDRLQLTEPVNLIESKNHWLKALAEADDFIRSRPAEEIGCLYYSNTRKTFVAPKKDETVGKGSDVVLHYGGPGGVLPQIDSGD